MMSVVVVVKPPAVNAPAIWEEQFGTTAPLAATTVPEPPAMASALLLVGMLMCYRRHGGGIVRVGNREGNPEGLQL